MVPVQGHGLVLWGWRDHGLTDNFTMEGSSLLAVLYWMKVREAILHWEICSGFNF